MTSFSWRCYPVRDGILVHRVDDNVTFGIEILKNLRFQRADELPKMLLTSYSTDCNCRHLALRTAVGIP